ncbi:MAG: hypothetical protein ABEJ40_03325 [Haloarculaceae archaeon]
MRVPAPVPQDALSRALVATGLAVLAVGLLVGALAPAAGVAGLGTGGDAPGQVDPASVGDGEGLSAFEQQLADRVASRLRSGAVNLSGGSYGNITERLNGTRYESLLSKYGAVANESGNESINRSYGRALERQAAFVAALDRYERVHDRWERVVNETRPGLGGTRPGLPAGNDSAGPTPPAGAVGDAIGGVPRPEPLARERALAHELGRIERRVARLGDDLAQRYWTLGRESGANFTAARRSVRERTENVSARQARVERRTLEPTSIEVTSWTSYVSFEKPFVFVGRVHAGDDAVANATVRLTLGNQSVTRTTGPNGTVAFALRPTTAPLDATLATVRYLPDNGSTAAASAHSVGVRIRQVTPTVTATVEPEPARFGDTVRISGRVASDGTGAAEVPVVVRVDGRVVERKTTGLHGRYDATYDLPSSVPVGEHRVRVTVPLAERALAGATRNATLTVARSGSSLNASVERVGGRELRVTGHLRANGRPVDGAALTVAVNGTAVGTARTGADGEFSTTVLAPADLVDGGLLGTTGRVSVTVRYDGAGSNVATAATTAVASVSASGRPVALAGGLAVLLAGVGGVALYRRRRDGGDTPGVDDGAGDGDAGAPEPVAGSTGADATSLLAAARDAAGSDPGRAVTVAYAALRRALESRAPPSADRRTHWEFYRDCRGADLDDETVSALREVTERYERVVYAGGAVDASAARATLERVAALVDEPTPETGTPGQAGDAGTGTTGASAPAED